MTTRLRHFPAHCVLITLVALMVSVMDGAAQEKEFATKGVVELGGSISFQSIAPVTNGTAGNSISAFMLEPFIGYFVADGFEIGVNPFGLTTFSGGGGSSTQVMILLAPSYNFRTSGKSHPFIEALVGYTASSGGTSTLSGISWGGRGGVKVEVTEKGLLNLAAQYLMINTSPSGASGRWGSNALAISAGFTLWL